MQNVAISRWSLVIFCKQRQRNEQGIITHAYTAIVLVAVRVCSLKPNEQPNTEQSNEHKTNEIKARSNKKTVEGTENVSAMTQNWNKYNDVLGSFEKAASAVHASRE